MSAPMSEGRRRLFIQAAHHQGGHSTVGVAYANVLGVPFPIRMINLCEALKREKEDPAAFCPWMREFRKEAP